DAVGSLDSLRPNPAEPDAPVAELRRARLAAAMLNGDALGIAKKRNVARAVHDPVQSIELWLCRAYHAFDWLLREAKCALGEDARRVAAFGVDVVEIGTPAPGVRNRVETTQHIRHMPP